MFQPVLRPSCLLVLCLLTPVSAGRAQEPPSFGPVFEALLRGDFAMQGLPGVAGAPGSIGDVRRVLARDGAIWVSAGPPEQRDRRRLIVAAVALHLANTIGSSDWRRAREVLEWGCSFVRRSAQPSEPERLWHWAAVAVTQASANGFDAELHAGHASSRFPDDPRFALARAVALELQSWPAERHRAPRDEDSILADRVIERFRTAAKYPETRAEANLRLGFFMLRHGNAGSALTHFRHASGVEEPHLRYLLGLFEGRAYDQDARLDDAIAAYRRAVTAVPGQTAQLALASALARSGRQAEALEIVQAAVRPGPETPDPWARYGQGDMRLWPRIAGALEAALR
jgi:tetratricopeptide (TPR) repeat protein